MQVIYSIPQYFMHRQLSQLLKHKNDFLKRAGRSRDCAACSIWLWLLLQDLSRQSSQQAKHVRERPFHLRAKYASTVIELGLVCSSTILGGIYVPQLYLHKRPRKLVQLRSKQLRAIWATVNIIIIMKQIKAEKGKDNKIATFNTIIMYCSSY